VERGNPISPPEYSGRLTERQIVGGVGVGFGKKRMPACNGLDTGSKFARLEREQTSHWCPITRNMIELPLMRKAIDSHHLVGWCASCLYGFVAISQYRKVGCRLKPYSGGWPNKGLPFGRLEPYDGKLSRTVLREERGGNTPDLPGALIIY
jgi:hypothetical protein